MESRSIILVLDNIRSMHNVGSIFRTADAFGIDAVYLCGFTPKPPHRDIQKTALGATESVSWKWFEDIQAALTEVKASGYAIVAIEQTPMSKPLTEFNPQPKMALILGNEVEGVGRGALASADMQVHVPQVGLKKSLNVSVCAGIVCWHLTQPEPK